jgi:protein-ribulosamine 3-kinase
LRRARTLNGDWSALAAALNEALGCPLAAAPAHAVGGGSISRTYRWDAAGESLFIKLAPAANRALLETEAAGLAALAAAGAVRVPAVRGHGVAGDTAWLALEWLELEAPHAAAEAALGECIANLHRCHAARFGFEADNFIGGTPQANGWLARWQEFLVERRLRPQLALAARNGYRGRLQERGTRLVELAGVFYAGYRPTPSLLHGDLWGGNRAMLAAGTPVLFDPAPYFGDREADLAMTRLFGGFDARFHAAYDAAWPLDPGAPVRRELLNLYHVLNHLNLFGGGYGPQALGMIDRLLAAAGH